MCESLLFKNVEEIILNDSEKSSSLDKPRTVIVFS
jgi:hypothetical protein